MIEVKDIYKKYRKKQVLNGLSLTIEEGKITCILGINGVGKSTTLKAICNLINIDSGEILIDGEKLNHSVYDKIAFVPDADNNFSNTTIKESFEFMKKFYKNWDDKKAYEILDMFELTDDLYIDELSKGNKARVKLIIAFSQNSKYILLDEPFSGIDIFKRESFIKAMTRYIDDNQSIIITTHEISEIEAIVDDVYLVDNGKVILKFNAEETREIEGKSILDKIREVYNDK